MSYLYIILSLTILWWIRIMAEEEDARYHGLIILSGLYIAYALVMDKVLWNKWVGALVVWIVASNIWATNKDKGMTSSLMWAGCGVVAMVGADPGVQQVGQMVIVGIGVLATIVRMWKVWRKKDDRQVGMVVGGNRAYEGAYLALCATIGLMNGGVGMVVGGVICMVGVVLSRCKGSIGALIAALLTYFILSPEYSMEMGLYMMGVLILVGTYYLSYNMDLVKTSVRVRKAITMVAGELAATAPLAGRGMESFRKHFPDVVGGLRSYGWFREIVDGDEEVIVSHRVHNEILETIVEVGIIGAILIGVIITIAIMNKPSVTPIMVCVTVISLVFFPLREVHTAVPFWLVVGGAVEWKSVEMDVVTIAIGCAIAGAVVSRAMIRIVGCMNYHMYRGKTKEGDRIELIEEAIKCDPENNKYLSARLGVPILAAQEINAVSRMWTGYDGCLRKWEMLGQMAEVLHKRKCDEWAKVMCMEALSINPQCSRATRVMSNIKEGR